MKKDLISIGIKPDVYLSDRAKLTDPIIFWCLNFLYWLPFFRWRLVLIIEKSNLRIIIRIICLKKMFKTNLRRYNYLLVGRLTGFIIKLEDNDRTYGLAMGCIYDMYTCMHVYRAAPDRHDWKNNLINAFWQFQLRDSVLIYR